MFYKKAVRKNFAIFTRKYLCWSLLLIKLQAWRPAKLLKRESNTGVFPRILQNFLELLFWRTSASVCLPLEAFCSGIVNISFANASFYILQRRIQRFWKGVALYVSHHGWPTKKVLAFRWSKKAKITLETTSCWQNISTSIFKFSPYLHTIKACQWNVMNFSKFANAFIRKEKKRLCSSQWEKKNWEKLDLYVL